jgi:hypothetical protein
MNGFSALLNPRMNLCVAATPPRTNSSRQSATPMVFLWSSTYCGRLMARTKHFSHGAFTSQLEPDPQSLVIGGDRLIPVARLCSSAVRLIRKFNIFFRF